jgi:hypothetical protein
MLGYLGLGIKESRTKCWWVNFLVRNHLEDLDTEMILLK